MGKRTDLTAEFLWKAASSLPVSTKTQQLLKSYYLTRSSLTNDTMCKKCSTLWSDAQFSISINPIKCRQKSKINRLNKNLEKRKKEAFGESLRIPIKKMKRLCNNVAIITCLVCREVLKINIFTKPKSKSHLIENQINPIQQVINPKDTNSTKPKKTKAKKDKTSGLKIPSEITSNIKNNNSSFIKEEQHKSAIQISLSKSENNNKNDKLNNKILHKFNINSNQKKNNKNFTNTKLDTKIINDKKKNLRLLAIALKQKNNKIVNNNNNLESFLI